MNTKILLISTAIIIGSTSAAVPGGDLHPLDEEITSLDVEQFALNADSAFEKIDINKSYTIEVDEYAAQAYVYAELARFNQYVIIEGETVIKLPLPEDATQTLSLSERTRISAVARREYYSFAGDDGLMSEDEWVSSRMNYVVNTDRNNDGRISGNELTAYARSVAKLPSTSA